MDLEQKISELRNELKTDRLDMSFGEIMSIFESGDLIISPEYQRAYRWTDEQRTRFIESILLGIPIPPIFVAEDTSGKWELVDGLQRISTILSFFGLLTVLPEKNKFALLETDLLDELLVGLTCDMLPVKLKRTLQRAVCRVEILRWDSQLDMRYELFNRLNTGSSPLKEQEIRNCIFTGEFNNLLHTLSQNANFLNIVVPTDKQKEEMFTEELVLRFFAFKFEYKEFVIHESIQAYLTHFMKDVKQGVIVFDMDTEAKHFLDVVKFLNANFDYTIFRARNGLFTPNLYDTVMYVASKFYDYYSNRPSEFKSKCDELRNDDEYKTASGASTYATKRMQAKIKRAIEIFNA